MNKKSDSSRNSVPLILIIHPTRTYLVRAGASTLWSKKVGARDYLKADGIVACYHEPGSDEQANRALKDYGVEQVPFNRFNLNAAWYYSILPDHFMMESFKEDVGAPVVPIGAYATTVRRRLMDIAGKSSCAAGRFF